MRVKPIDFVLYFLQCNRQTKKCYIFFLVIILQIVTFVTEKRMKPNKFLQ